jgi:hypothetical protein
MIDCLCDVTDHERYCLGRRDCKRTTEPARPVEDRADTPPLCPECRVGKCGNCDGTALDETTDEIVGCGCPSIDHFGVM